MVGYIALFISFVIVSVLIFVDPFGFPQETKDAIIPWATLTLALVAVLTIIHSDLKDERRRKLLRLQDIMEWATDVLSATQVVAIPEEKPWSKDLDLSYERFRQIDKINDFKRLSIQGEHIRIISLRVDKELCSAVTTVAQAIDDLLKDNWHSFDVITTRNWLAEHESRIYNLVKTLINEATERLESC